MPPKLITQAITFDDVLLLPRYSEVVPAEVNVGTQLTRNIRLNIPLVSSPMDTVTESDMAIALAQEGGLGVIHKNMSLAQQTEEVDKVKRSANGIIFDPVTLPPTATVAKAREVMDQANISGVPIVASTSNKKLLGIITRRDLRFLETSDTPISEIMTRQNLVTAQGTVTLAEAEKILMANKVEKLLLVDEDYTLTGLITIKDIDMQKRFPNACKDKLGRLRVGAAHWRSRLRTGRKPDWQGSRCAGGRQCPRPFGQCDRDGSDHQETMGDRRGRRKRGDQSRSGRPD